MAKLNPKFCQLRDRYGLNFLRHGKGSHQVWAVGDRLLIVGDRAWRHGDPGILQHVEKHIRRLTP